MSMVNNQKRQLQEALWPPEPADAHHCMFDHQGLSVCKEGGRDRQGQ